MRKLKVAELHRKSIEEFRKSEKIPVVVVLDNVRSLYNVGVVFRSCDAFAVQSLYLCGITPKPPHRAIEKTALGSTKSVHWKYFNDTVSAVKELKNTGYTIVAVEQAEGSISLEKFELEEGRSYAFVFGHEVKGISEEAFELCDQCIEIPQLGTKHSLNIAITASIVLWHVTGRIKKITVVQ